MKEKAILTQVAAIEAMHDSVGMPSPVATTAARFALSQVVSAAPPRSWTKSEKLLWAALPEEVRAVIQRRDANQEAEMRRVQNEAAELRKTCSAEKATDNTTEGIEIMAKKQNGEGAFHHNDGDPIVRRDRGICRPRAARTFPARCSRTEIGPMASLRNSTMSKGLFKKQPQQVAPEK